MFGKRFYTLWRGKADGTDEPILLDAEPFFKTKHRAFKRARKLSSELPPNWGLAILVRLVTIGSDICTEWVFEK